MVFIHGLGIGLSIYIPFFLMLPKDIGILAIEVLPVSSRICEAGLLPVDQMREIGDIISQQGLNDFVFIGNSYGTFFTKMFLESSFLSSRMSRVVLIDPVAVLLHLPNLAYNFTRKKPVEANEWQIWWAAETEPDIAFTLSKRFCWRSHVLWREDMLKHPTTVILGGRDCLVNSEAIAAYVAKGVPESDVISAGTKSDLQWDWEDRETWKKSLENWKGEGLELVWLEGYDHGQGLLGPKMLPRIVKIVEDYCTKEGNKNAPERQTHGDEGMDPEFRGYEPDTKALPELPKDRESTVV